MKFLRILLMSLHCISRAGEVLIKTQFENQIHQLNENLIGLIDPDTITEQSLEKVFVATDEAHELIKLNPEIFIQIYGLEAIQNVYQLLDELSVFGYVSQLIALNKFQEIQNIRWKYTAAEKILYGGEHKAQEQMQKVRSATYRYQEQYFELFKHHHEVSPLKRQIIFLSLVFQNISINSLTTIYPVFADFKQTLEKIRQAFAMYATIQGINLTAKKTNLAEIFTSFNQDITALQILI